MKKLIAAALLSAPCITALAQSAHIPSASPAASAAVGAAAGAAAVSVPRIEPLSPSVTVVRPAVGAGSGGPDAVKESPHAHKPECEKEVWFCEHANNCYYKKQRDC